MGTRYVDGVLVSYEDEAGNVILVPPTVAHSEPVVETAQPSAPESSPVVPGA